MDLTIQARAANICDDQTNIAMQGSHEERPRRVRVIAFNEGPTIPTGQEPFNGIEPVIAEHVCVCVCVCQPPEGCIHRTWYINDNLMRSSVIAVDELPGKER